ncbi:MAG: hypothetical protein HY360_11440 [Verrucomicrobia bacterium]|nr:hypothetical protein [Verrucomicrobiota bacterium]
MEATCLDVTRLKGSGPVTNFSARLNADGLASFSPRVLFENRWRLEKTLWADDWPEGQTRRVWLKLRTPAKLGPKKTHEDAIGLSADGKPFASIPVRLELFPVALPEKRLTDCLPWYEVDLALNRSGLLGSPEAEQLAAWKAYAADLAEGGVRSINFGGPYYAQFSQVFGGKGGVPLNTEKLDRFVAVGKAVGLDRAFVLDANRPLIDYLIKAGFTQVVIPMLDESPLVLPDETVALMKKRRQEMPDQVPLHGALSPVSIELINFVQPYIRTWVFGGGLAESVQQWQDEGKIKIPADQDFGFYGGGAYVYKMPFEEGQRNGWYAGWLPVRHWGMYCYLRDRPANEPWQAVFPTREGPATTSGWEGFKDGNEIMELLAMLREKAGRPGCIAWRKQIERIVGGLKVPLGVDATISDGVSMHTILGDYRQELAAKRLLLEKLCNHQ